MFLMIKWKDGYIKLTNREYQFFLKRQNKAEKELSLARDQLEALAFIYETLESEVFKHKISEAFTNLVHAKGELFLSKYIPRKWSTGIQKKNKTK